MRSCRNSPVIQVSSKPFNRDSAMKVIRSEVEELAMLHKITETKDSIQKVYITRWLKVKADTIHETKTQIVNTCDSTISKDTALVNSQRRENESQANIIRDLFTVNKVDSNNYAARGDTIKVLVKQNKKLLRVNWWLKAANVGQALLNGWQIVRP